MFLGHYAFGLYLKKKNPETPLWTLLLCVQLVDLLWAMFLIFGVERASYNPEASVFLRAVYEYYPYTHSLFAAIVIGLLGWLVARAVMSRKSAVVIGLALASHWFLDLVVHGPDLPIFHNFYKVGLGLWTYPTLTLCLELFLLTVGFWYVLRDVGGNRIKRQMGYLFAFLVFFYVVSFFAPAATPSALQIGIFGILLYGGIPLWAYLIERNRVGLYAPKTMEVSASVENKPR